MIKASAVVLAVGEISPEGSRLYIMGIHSGFFFFLFQTILYVLQVIHLHISVNIIGSRYVCVDIFKGCFCGCWYICASFQGALAEECRRNFPRMGAGSVVSATLKKKKKRWSDLLLFSHLQLPICCSFFTTPPLRSSLLLLLLLPPSLCPSASPWVRSRGVKQCWKFERRWMNSLKECKREWEWLGLRSLVWISLACGRAPLHWMNG